VELNGTTIALKHYAPAHTDSDISVHFKEADIFHIADTFWNGYYPFIDYSTGGSIDGMIRATEGNLAKVTDTMIVIPGHGAIGNKSQLAFYRDLLVGTREKVAAWKKQGQSLDEIIAAKPTAATDAQWGNGFRSRKTSSGTFSRAFDVLANVSQTSTNLGRRALLLFDRAELCEQGKKIGLITGLCNLPVAEPIQADSADRCLLLCR
jgi:hypothetical protein